MMSVQKFIHPIFLKLLPLARTFQLRPFSVRSLPNDRGIIFVANHSNMHEFPVSAEIIKRHVYVLADDAPKRKAVGLAFDANGVIWMNRLDKESRKRSMQKMRFLLRNKENLLVFPEGTWNLNPCIPMLPFSWGVIELAQEFGAPIVPVTLEYPDFETCYYSIGTPIYFEKADDKKEAVLMLRDVMATMRWLFWESRGTFHRPSISEIDYDIYVSKRIEEYPDFDYIFEKGMIFCPGVVSKEEVFDHLSNLNPGRENAFLLNKHAHY